MRIAERIAALSPQRRAALVADLNPLSFAQQREWFAQQLHPDTGIYNIAGVVRITGPLRVEVIERALTEVARRHEILRTSFPAIDGTPYQAVSAPRRVSLEVEDLGDLDSKERYPAAVRRAEAARGEPFDLAEGPMFRTRAWRLAADDHLAAFIIHHILADVWSMGILIRECAALYEAFSRDEPSPLPPLRVQYGDYARWQRSRLQGEALEQLIRYWRSQLEGAPARLTLPTDRPRPPVQTYQGAREGIRLSPELSARLRSFSRENGVSLFMTLLAAFQSVLYWSTGQSDVSVGTSVATRTQQELEGLIGYFINPLVLRTQLSGNPRFRELLARVRTTALGAYAHQDLPFEKLVEVLRPRRDPGHTPLFQVLLTLQEVPRSYAIETEGLTLTTVDLDDGEAKYDLTIYMWEGQDRLAGSVWYNSDLFDATTVGALLGRFERLLERAVADPEQRLSDLEIATAPRVARRGPRAAVSRRRAALPNGRRLVSESLLDPERALPLVLLPELDSVDLASWARLERRSLEDRLARHGAMLFRGFAGLTPSTFRDVAGALSTGLVSYPDGTSPRTEVADKVYTSTDYPPEFEISMHNELSYAHEWPARLFFFCAAPASRGGETPLADGREVLEYLGRDLVERFVARGVRYRRHLHGGRGAGLSWQDAFETQDPSRVERYCREAECEFSWTGDGGLLTSQVRDAVVVHPRTGKRVWFNQVHQWHPSNLGDELARVLTGGDRAMPLQASYGDGGELEAETLGAIRAAYARASVRFPWEQGDLLVIDNTLVAHGRCAFSGPRRVLVAMGDRVTAAEARAKP